jgi:hypothetical protein
VESLSEFLPRAMEGAALGRRKPSASPWRGSRRELVKKICQLPTPNGGVRAAVACPTPNDGGVFWIVGSWFTRQRIGS